MKIHKVIIKLVITNYKYFCTIKLTLPELYIKIYNTHVYNHKTNNGEKNYVSFIYFFLIESDPYIAHLTIRDRTSDFLSYLQDLFKQSIHIHHD